MNNAAKYANASEVELFLAYKRGWLVMKVKDNGTGFDPGASPAGGGGNGLQNMKLRAEEIGGKLDIHSGPEGGTSVELKVRT